MRIEVRGEWVYRDGVLAAKLLPGSKRPLLARDNHHVVDLLGNRIGFVRRQFMGLRWVMGKRRAYYSTIERALEELFLLNDQRQKWKATHG